MEIYDFNSVLPDGRYKGKTVQEIFDKDKSNIFKLIKKYGYSFSDDVLAAAHITKTVRDVKVYLEWERHMPDKNAKKYKKENKTIDEILDEFDDERTKFKEIKEDTKSNKNEAEFDEIKIDEIDAK